ncbi:hypothetical protein YC2023_054404 [Brassica napus]
MNRGWRSFCVANKKKPEDMFKFKLVQNEETPVIHLLPLNSEYLHKVAIDPAASRKKNQITEDVFFHYVEPSDECDTRQGLEATEKEFLGVETNRNDTSQSKEAIKIRTRSKATIKEENITTSQNRFVTLTATPTAHSTQFPLWARKSSVGVHEREWNQQRREDNDEGQVRYKMVDGTTDE